MRQLILVAGLLALGACGGNRETAARDALDGVRGYLARAFADGAPEGGGLCGDPYLVGDEVGTVPGPGACGIEGAVALRAVGDVRLSRPSQMTCGTAKALRTWVDKAAGPAFEKQGGLTELKVAAHYACRTRNHQPGARISEHGKGKAIDISAFGLRDGSEVTVLDGWSSKAHGAVLRELHKAACGPFGTVLGPESDRFHKDHFHFDTADHRGGPYCR